MFYFIRLNTMKTISFELKYKKRGEVETENGKAGTAGLQHSNKDTGLQITVNIKGNPMEVEDILEELGLDEIGYKCDLKLVQSQTTLDDFDEEDEEPEEDDEDESPKEKEGSESEEEKTPAEEFIEDEKKESEQEPTKEE